MRVSEVNLNEFTRRWTRWICVWVGLRRDPKARTLVLALRSGVCWWMNLDVSARWGQVFRPEQQTQLRQTTLARILCDTGDSLAHIKRDVFLMNSQLVSCSLVPSPLIGFWAESENCCDDKSRPTCPHLATLFENFYFVFCNYM